MQQRNSILVATVFTALASLGLFYLALAQGWFGPYENAGCGFCEAMRPGLVKQPANTWSNLGFVAAGLSMAWSLARGRFQTHGNVLTRSTFVATFFCCLVVLLGPGSMSMHASGAKLGGFIDVLSMYLVAAFLVAYSSQRLLRFGSLIFTLAFFGVLAACLWANRQHSVRIGPLSFGNLAFAFFLLLTAVLEIVNLFARRVRQNALWGYASLGAILLAFFIWNMSLTNGPWCDPASLLQGHAAWHLLDALSIYCMFRFYVSEQA